MAIRREDIKYIFNSAVLKKGDILLINTYDDRVHEIMKSEYDHVALYAGDAFIMESDGGGVVLNHLFAYGFKEKKDAVVLRCISDSDLIREGVIFYAMSTMGMEFGAREARRVPEYEATDAGPVSNRMFCSRLVALSYDKMGVELVQNPNYCKPAAFLDSDKLVIVENALVDASEEDKRVFGIHSKVKENAENVEMLVDVFEKMSILFGLDIQTMDQLIKAALSKPELEEEAIKVLKETDYYKRRFEGRDLFCLNDKEAFEAKYDSFERRVWFLVNQNAHLEKTYIPNASANARAFSVLAARYPKSKVIAFFRDFFKDNENELIDYHIWVCALLISIIDEDPASFKRVVGENPDM